MSDSRPRTEAPSVTEIPSSEGSSGLGTDAGASSSGMGFGLDSERDLLADFPAMASLPGVESLLPDVDAPSSSVPGRLSPEIQALLDNATRRVQQAAGVEPAVTGDDTPVMVPAELMQTVCELLATEDEPPATTDASQLAMWMARPVRADPASRTGVVTSAPGLDLGTRGSQPSAPPPGEATSVRTSRSDPPNGTKHPGSERARTEHPRTGVTATEGSGTGVIEVPPSQLEASGPMTVPQDVRAAHGLFESRSSGSRAPAPSQHPTIAQLQSAFPPAAGVISERPPSLSPARAGTEAGHAELGDPIEALARAIRGRATGAIELRSGDGQRVRYIVLRDGDVVTASSEVEDEALLHFLAARGDVSRELAAARAPRLPPGGRRAAAALIAHGFLSQDELWPVLRAHAEWTISRALLDAPAVGRQLPDSPELLRAEPNVFGGATGVEVFVDVVRRVVTPEVGIARMGGAEAMLGAGPAHSLLAESALEPDDVNAVRATAGSTVGQVLAPRGADTAALLYALCALQILQSSKPALTIEIGRGAAADPLDAESVRKKVAARMALVREGDYFSLLGISPRATSYEIRRAFVDLRRSYEPARLLTAATADLRQDVELIVDILEEAYEVLRDQHRRARYRRAIEATTS